ncbi:MAG: hypothetical protein K2P76_13605 [Lachnospiraceae bacterium]|nr:hypothetical protein [Lachnospiraceae bacterium]MDE6981793.1 hypothetical protein [Lachnospiraceae bacterium]
MGLKKYYGKDDTMVKALDSLPNNLSGGQQQRVAIALFKVYKIFRKF